MSTVYEIPMSNSPQTQTVSLGGISYTLKTRWNQFAECWMLDISDPTTGDPILTGIPMITGADLLAQYAYLNIGNGAAMVVQSDNDPDLVPDDSTLGTTGHLFYVQP